MKKKANEKANERANERASKKVKENSIFHETILFKTKDAGNEHCAIKS